MKWGGGGIVGLQVQGINIYIYIYIYIFASLIFGHVDLDSFVYKPRK
jgi:hypothetical protein